MSADDDPSNLLDVSPNITESIILISVLILLNAFFAMAELALVSVRKSRVKQLVEENVNGAKEIQKLTEDPARFLSTVQIGVTLVGFFASAAGAVTLANPLAESLKGINIEFITNNASGIAVAMVTIVIGYVSLVVGEITPKSIGLHYAEQVALFAAKPLLFLSYIASPLVALVTWSSNILAKPIGVTAGFTAPVVTEEELKILVEESEEDGILEEEEKEMIHSIFEFTDTVVRKVMTPRIDIKAVEADASMTELLDIITTAGHSRVPVYDDSIDNIVGIVHAKDLLQILHDNKTDFSIRDIMRAPYLIPENKMVDELLAEFKRSKIQMAIVVEEYGGTAGLVTIEDLLEEIVGDIMDEYDNEEPSIVIIDENTAIVDARTPIDEVNESMNLSLPDEEFDTIGGFVFGQFGRKVYVGVKIRYESVDLIVEQTDGNRIQKVKVINDPSKNERDVEDEQDTSES